MRWELLQRDSEPRKLKLGQTDSNTGPDAAKKVGRL
jgi:hypothetical protein